VVLDVAGQVIAAVAGVADGEGFSIDLPADMPEGTTVLELLAEARVVGALLVERPEGDGMQADVPLPAVDAESTLEALVAVHLLGQGEGVDRNLLERLVDHAVAEGAASEGEAGVAVVAEAVLAAQLAFADALGSSVEACDEAGSEARASLEATLAAAFAAGGGGIEGNDEWARFYAELRAALEATLGADAGEQADATLAATAAFEGVIDALAGGDSGLAIAAAARARIENALCAAEDLEGQAEDAGMSDDITARLHAAVEALVVATARAQDAGDAEDAGEDFEAALRGRGESILAACIGEMAGGRQGIAALISAAISTTSETLVIAEGALTTSLRAAVVVEGEGVNAGECADGTLAAYGTFHATVDALGNLGLRDLGAGQVTLLVEILAHASAGLYGERL
jgi:hypothetical protein